MAGAMRRGRAPRGRVGECACREPSAVRHPEELGLGRVRLRVSTRGGWPQAGDTGCGGIERGWQCEYQRSAKGERRARDSVAKA